MRTLLSRFCEEFDAVVRPVLDPLERASDALAGTNPTLPGREVLPELRDAHHQVETLVDKVREQQAYVLIFGPLKSGKSTLMNAVSAAYVSEVTSLPAYPCMVYVSHSDEQEFIVRRYDGRSDNFSDSATLHMQINRAHTELADRLREIETRGDEFDPSKHMPEAVRRIDVKLPAGHLQSSGAVLVDTPGLYSRMKFGYDRMTREFRNAAACAIFVVKSDNLFLEQVFEEFNQLLQLFSRIFLVVNLDTEKVDLKSDGSLEPSLERKDPLRLIQAFENLAMSAPLKEAADEGRLRIYPVDLLRAASRRLKGDERTATEGESADEFEGQANFDAFLDDLTEFLNSTEYLVAFLGDSLRQATTFLNEASDICDSDAAQRLGDRVTELDERRAKEVARLDAVKRLMAHDWIHAFQGLQETLETGIDEHARGAVKTAADGMGAAVDDWFANNSSLQALMGDGLIPALREFRTDVGRFIHEGLSERVTTGHAGILVPANLSRDLMTAGVHLGDLGREAVAEVGPDTGKSPIEAPLHASEIPVKKSFWDWILFRSRATVNRRIFGPDNRPGTAITSSTKLRRLGEPAKQEMLRRLEEYRETFYEDSVVRLKKRVLGEYAEAVTRALKFRLEAEEELLGETLKKIDAERDEAKVVLSRFDELKDGTRRALEEVENLSTRYGQTDPSLLTQPAEASDLADVVLTPATQPEGEEVVVDETEETPTPEAQESASGENA